MISKEIAGDLADGVQKPNLLANSLKERYYHYLLAEGVFSISYICIIFIYYFSTSKGSKGSNNILKVPINIEFLILPLVPQEVVIIFLSGEESAIIVMTRKRFLLQGAKKIMTKKDFNDNLSRKDGRPTNAAVSVFNWDEAAQFILDETKIKTYNNTLPIIYKDGKWQMLEKVPQEALANELAKLNLNMTPGLIKNIAKHAEMKMDNFDVHLSNTTIYFSNGDFDIKTGIFTPIANPEFNHRRLPRPYIAPAQNANGLTKLSEFLRQYKSYPEHKIEEQIWEMIGAIMVPTEVFRTMFQLYGNGHNGKSVLMELIMNAVGVDKTSTQGIDQLISERAFDRLPLVNKMWNYIDELEKTKGKSAGRLKTLVAGNTTTAEIKGGKIFSFKNEATIVFGANYHLESNDGGESEALEDRLHVIKFTKRFKDDNGNIVSSLKDVELLKEDEEILNAIVLVGAHAAHKLWKNNKRFTTNTETDDAKREYKIKTDSVYAWLQDTRFTFFDEFRRVDSVYEEYIRWCERSMKKPLEKQNFGTSFKKHTKDKFVKKWKQVNGDGFYAYFRTDSEADQIKEKEAIAALEGVNSDITNFNI